MHNGYSELIIFTYHKGACMVHGVIQPIVDRSHKALVYLIEHNNQIMQIQRF